MSYSPGTLLLNKYRIERLLGQGAFGEVYLVTHLALNIPRALRVLRKDAPGLSSQKFERCRSRFQMEATLGARLNTPTPHPNLLQVYDFETDGAMLALCMQYAPGGSLAQQIEQARNSGKPISIARAVRWTMEAAQGLAELHRRDLVHRDVKPSNILLDAENHARIGDLGLAQTPQSPQLRLLEGSLASFYSGTREYMPPEQVQPHTQPLRPNVDVYALGCTLFELLTGRVLFLQRPGTRLRSLRADAPQWLDDLVERMLEEDAKKRPWDGAEVAGLLRREVKIPAKNAGTVRRAGERLFVDLGEEVEMELILIPAGEFLMGSPDQDQDATNSEKPQHMVYLDEYWIGRYPVTNRQYYAFVQSARRAAPIGWSGDKFPEGKQEHPVVYVSWQDALAFCKWVGGLLRRNEETLVVRLPTEVEWEKAARRTDRRIYPWGKQSPDKTLCNFDQTVGNTTPVGKYSPLGDSPYGCADMAGNVWEWVNDWISDTYYRQSPARNPFGPGSGAFRGLRGGAWNNNGWNVRSAFRSYCPPDYWDLDIGFRCAASL